ncbi:MAG TPA: hypothetical protein VJO33_00405, partial [Gemmatimonadaceae bacterium]|nr:hypothetical protein [Gemmatimonadaceae bacterium]
VASGVLDRVGRGLYRLPEQSVTEHHGIVLASAAIPTAVICLISALSYHRIGTQVPHEIWIAVERRARRPSVSYPPLRIIRPSGEGYSAGIQTIKIEGQRVRVYNVAKTLADCFKYRNKIGLDVAIEALREAWRARRFTMEELDGYAAICRVQRVMRPYLEALVG